MEYCVDQVRHGRMPFASYVKIQTNFMYLLDNITNPEYLCDRLFSKAVLDYDDMERIYKMKDCRGRKYATEFLLIILQYRGDVYDTFIECLRECGYNSLADRLEMGGGGITGLLNEVNNAWTTQEKLKDNYGNTKKELAELKERTQSMEQNIKLLQESNIEIACNLKHAIGQCEATNTDLAEEKTKHEVTWKELKNTKTDLAEEKAKHEVTWKELKNTKTDLAEEKAKHEVTWKELKNTTESMVKQIQELEESNKDSAEREAATTDRIQYLESRICKSVKSLGDRGMSNIETARDGEQNHEDTTKEISNLITRALKLVEQLQNLKSSSCISSKKSPADTSTGSAAVETTEEGTGSAAVETTEEGSEEMEEYEEIDPSDFMQCDVDGVTGCDIDFVRDKFGQGTKGVYPMRKEKRGICLIINNYFYPKTSNKYRGGTEKDVEALKALFKELEFVVQLEEELSASKIIKMLESCRLEINSSDDMPDCFILFILTHGKEGCVQGMDGKFVDITKIRDCFDYNNCPKLQGTPKLFFIQACQGTRREYMEVQTDTVASIEDYYLAIATSPGFVSYRHRQHGSWFVQAIVATCKTYACKESFQKMMERIEQEMRNVGSNRKKYEMNPIKKTKNTRPKPIVIIATPCFENELKKDLFFFPKSGTDLE